MATFPYCQVNRRLKDFFDKIRDVRVPKKADREWLSSIGFGSQPEASIIPVLRFIGFVDASGVPTQRWHDFRNSAASRAVLAEAIRQSYGELFDTYPDAHRRDAETLRRFFHTKQGAGKQVTSKTLGTFQALCELADFDAVPAAVPPLELGIGENSSTESHTPVPRANRQPVAPGLAINLNIQLALPETTDESVYDRIFSAMRKHLWPGAS